MEASLAGRLQQLKTVLVAGGFDVVQEMDVCAYNRLRDDKGGTHKAPDFGRQELATAEEMEKGEVEGKGGCCGLLVGNSRALWPKFLQYVAADPIRKQACDPLYDYVEDFVSHAVEETLGAMEEAERPRVQLRYSHQMADGLLLSFQDVGAVSGSVQNVDECFMCVHPVHGAWVSLRALIVCDSPCSPAVTNPCSVPDLVPPSRRPELKTAVTELFTKSSSCGSAAALDDWVDFRQALYPVDDTRKYTAAQIRYHYLGDKKVLDQ